MSSDAAHRSSHWGSRWAFYRGFTEGGLIEAAAVRGRARWVFCRPADSGVVTVSRSPRARGRAHVFCRSTDSGVVTVSRSPRARGRAHVFCRSAYSGVVTASRSPRTRSRLLPVCLSRGSYSLTPAAVTRTRPLGVLPAYRFRGSYSLTLAAFHAAPRGSAVLSLSGKDAGIEPGDHILSVAQFSLFGKGARPL